MDYQQIIQDAQNSLNPAYWVNPDGTTSTNAPRGYQPGKKWYWWFITANLRERPNDPELEFRKLLQDCKADYGIGQLEKGESGTYHFQCVLHYESAVRPSHFKSRPYWTKGLSPSQAQPSIKYCTKEDTRVDGPFEHGKQPRMVAKKQTLEEAFELLKAGRKKEISGEIQIKYKRNLDALAASFTIPVRHETTRGLWIYGEPGVGKSHHVRTTYSDLYIKGQNKWFDGYMDQKYVLLDDFDKSGKCLGHLLKIWADKWEAFAEIKGAQVALNYERFIITSNYHPDEIWPPEEDKALNAAITRRFEIQWLGHQPAYLNALNIDTSIIEF